MKRHYVAVVGKSLAALAVLALLWFKWPGAAMAVGAVTILCLSAYWGNVEEFSRMDVQPNPDDFQMRLNLIAAARAHEEPAVREPAPVAKLRHPVAELLLGEILPATATVTVCALLFRAVHLPKTAAMLLFVSILFLIARHWAMPGTLAASGIATLATSMLFLQPIGSIWVARANDRLSLISFVAVSLVGCLWICSEKNNPGRLESDPS